MYDSWVLLTSNTTVEYGPGVVPGITIAGGAESENGTKDWSGDFSDPVAHRYPETISLDLQWILRPCPDCNIVSNSSTQRIPLLQPLQGKQSQPQAHTSANIGPACFLTSFFNFVTKDEQEHSRLPTYDQFQL